VKTLERPMGGGCNNSKSTRNDCVTVLEHPSEFQNAIMREPLGKTVNSFRWMIRRANEQMSL
jgi:hypothetical protein